jgi:hypothetical protein
MMYRKSIRLFALFALALIPLLSGCSATTKQALKDDAVSIAKQGAAPVAQQLTLNALNKAAVKAPASTLAAAKALVTMTSNDLIPYFSGQPVLAASSVQDLLSTKLGSIIPASVDSGLTFATSVSSIIDALQIPPAQTISDNERTIIVNGLNGMLAGAKQFLAKQAAAAPTSAAATSAVPVPPVATP